MKVNAIPTTYDDQYRKTIILYADKDDGNVFYDEGKTEKVPTDDLQNLFFSGITVVYNKVYYTPTCFYKESTGEGSAVTVSKDGTDLVFYSKEHEASGSLSS